MLEARVWTMIRGSVHSTTRCELCSIGSGRVSSVASPAVPSKPGSECSHSRLMPVLSLSNVVTVTSTRLGSRLKCMRGTHSPAIAESISRLRFSAR